MQSIGQMHGRKDIHMKEFKGKIGDCPDGYCIKDKLGKDHWEIEKCIDFQKLQKVLEENNKKLVEKLNANKN